MKNKQNQFWCRLYNFTFALILAGLPLSWLLARNFTNTTNYENRELTPMPTFANTAIEKYPAKTEAFFADHAPYRNQFMSLNAQINWALFSVIDSETTLAGTNGWLFYKNAEDSASLDDYQGTNPYTETQMQEILQNLLALEAALSQKGAQLAVIIPPSKELVYSQFMPASVPVVNHKNRIDVLKEYIQQNSELTFVWPLEDFRALSKSQRLYYKYDTHWNEAGGAYAAALLMQALKTPNAPSPSQLQYIPSQTPPLLDLASLSATWDIFSIDEAWAAVLPQSSPTATLTYIDDYGYIKQYESASANKQKLLMFKDSFGADMESTLAAHFAKSSFVHINAFSEKTFENEMPNIFIIEITQRYSDRLLDYLPRLVEWAEK